MKKCVTVCSQLICFQNIFELPVVYCSVSMKLEIIDNCQQSVHNITFYIKENMSQYIKFWIFHCTLRWKHEGEVLKSEPCAHCIIHALPALHSLKSLYLSWWKGQLWWHGAVVHCRRLCNNQRDSLAVLCSCHPAQWRERCQCRGPSANCCSVSSALSWKEESHWTRLERNVLFL